MIENKFKVFLEKKKHQPTPFYIRVYRKGEDFVILRGNGRGIIGLDSLESVVNMLDFSDAFDISEYNLSAYELLYESSSHRNKQEIISDMRYKFPEECI